MKKSLLLVCSLVFFGFLASAASSDAFADGIAHAWQMGFQTAASPTMEKITSFHHLLMIIITAISVFVLLLLVYVSLRYNSRANPVPSKTTHNLKLEIIWTAIPVLILVIIMIPSFRLLYFEGRTPENIGVTLKVTGHQWYWSYEYPDQKIASFDSNIVQDKDLQPGQPRLLTVDQPIVLPTDTNIRVVTTGADVIHSWAMPAFGFKVDAMPGRLNEGWFRITKEGTYYGQCSEICGLNHGYMPIQVLAVSPDKFNEWVEQKNHPKVAAANPKLVAKTTR